MERVVDTPVCAEMSLNSEPFSNAPGVLKNTMFDTYPVVFHAQGKEIFSPHWPVILRWFFDSDSVVCSPDPRLTIVTWNHHAYRRGVFEKSLAHLGLSALVLGRGVKHWVNSLHKPRLVLEALKTIRSEYVLAVDGFDAIALRNPAEIIERFETDFSCDLLFNAGKVCWPQLERFRTFERSIPEATTSPFRYLNGGAWIGRTQFCRGFFEAVAATPALEGWPQSEQGLLKQRFPDWYPGVSLDYRCRIFQTLQYVFDPIFEVEGSRPQSRYLDR